MKILVINPGSTSTKIAVYEDEKEVLRTNIKHPAEEIAKYNEIIDQKDFRTQVILSTLKDNNIEARFDAVIGRGGLLKPMAGGVYEVNQQMIDDATHAEHKHASNLGCIVAAQIAKNQEGCRAYIADPVVVDELSDVARVSGLPQMPRVSIWHALNQKAICRRYAKEQGKAYEDLRLICVHLGGGVSVAAHDHGLTVDVNNALDGEGPFSPERAGTLPAADLIRACFSGEYTEAQLLKMMAGKGGFAAHLGTNDALDVEIRALKKGDEKARLVFDAMIYQIAKNTGAQAAVLCGQVDAILVTGGMAHSPYICDELRRRCGFIAPICVYPGEDELEALATNAYDVLSGKREAKQYC